MLKKIIEHISFKIRHSKRKRITEKYIFSDLNRPVLKRKVNLHYWKRSVNTDNVGDLISKIIVERVLEKKNLSINQSTTKTYHLMAIGSIINHAKHNTTIWGSGIHDYNAKIPNVKFDIRAIRGPVSKKILEDNNITCPKIYGDPAILLPDFYNPKVLKTKDYIIIPHYSKESNYKEYNNVVSTITSDWKLFIQNILESKLVISGSLHGIILAEAYGIPAVLLQDIDQDYLKYNDYYQSTGRPNYIKASSVTEALELNPEDIPDFYKMKKDLLQSFPFDLWNNV